MNCFSPDSRNAGGRYLISGIQENHKVCLKLISSTNNKNSRPGTSNELSNFENCSPVLYKQKTARTGSVDCSAPFTLFLSNVLSKNKKKRKPAFIVKHENELKHLQSKLQKIHQKKSIFFTPGSASMRSSKIVSNTSVKSSLKSYKRPNSIRANSDFTHPFSIENILMDQIMGNTLYKDKDLEALYESVRKTYSFLPREEIESAIQEVKYVLDN